VSCARTILLTLFCVLFAAGCGSEPVAEGEPATAVPAGDASPVDPSILPRPFTAEQIREEMHVGFTVDVGQTTSEGEVLTRWTVIAADAEGVEIEYATLDAAGRVTGEREVERSLWIELRDHATFPVETSVREEVTRETTLGTLDGWLYTVHDEEAGAVTEFFFARELPGAPVYMRTTRGDQVMVEMVQHRRGRPE
jgi:hypothetical protein